MKSLDEYDLRELVARGDPSLSFIEDEELRKQLLHKLLQRELAGGIYKDSLPLHLQQRREKCLDSPSFFLTEVIDKYYKDHFEHAHYEVCDEVMAPYLLGETVRIAGVNYNPNNYVGLLVMMTRDSLKSTIAGLMLLWAYLHWKYRREQDLRAMYVHQVINKAIKRGEVIRQIARQHKGFRELFPDFRGKTGEWDTKQEWRWPCMTEYLAAEFSFVAYGETSDKTGGHYPVRISDDFESEESPTQAELLQARFEAFNSMENLADDREGYCPWMCVGTTYHYQGVHARLEREGGWLVYKVPAHTGSPKRIFEICSLDPRRDATEIDKKLDQLESDPPGELLFPRVLPWRKLYLKARALGPHQYNCQRLLNPTPEGEQRFDHEALDNSWCDDLPTPGEAWCYIRCDPAISEKKTADETAYTVSLVRWDGFRFFVDGWVGREKDPIEIIRTGFGLCRKWEQKGYIVKSIGFEAVQYQMALARIARYGIPERRPQWSGESVPMQKAPTRIVAIERSSEKTKHERIISMAGPISRYETKFWKMNPIARRQISQLKNFPHDRFDILDSMHDHWVRTQTPPPTLGDSSPTLHPLLAALMRNAPTDGPELRDTTVTVDLETWS